MKQIANNNYQYRKSGFTLVELSIALVIIGLIVGGVLVGQDLINAARIRSQISQIDQYKIAVKTFKLKYGYLPGDIPEPHASGFGLLPRGQYRGQGDGNDIIEGNNNNTDTGYRGDYSNEGETITLWVDLSTAGLIGETFNTARPDSSILYSNSPDEIKKVLPTARINDQNYIYAYSLVNTNYFGLANIMVIYANNVGLVDGRKTTLTVYQAYNIDNKIDDGLPMSGNVVTMHLISGGFPTYRWSNGNSASNGTTPTIPYTGATQASSGTCYDNNNSAGATQNYSITYDNGSGINCSLSFKMQY